MEDAITINKQTKIQNYIDTGLKGHTYIYTCIHINTHTHTYIHTWKGNTFFVVNGVYLYHLWHLRFLARSGRVFTKDEIYFFCHSYRKTKQIFSTQSS